MNKNPEVEILMTTDKVPFPMRATSGSAGFDICSALEYEVVIQPGEYHKIPLGFKMSIGNPNIVALLMPKSGTGMKGLGLKNFVGVIDSDFQGEVQAIIWNTNKFDEISFNLADHIGQMIFVPVVLVDFKPVEEFSTPSFRGESGLGSGVVEVDSYTGVTHDTWGNIIESDPLSR